MSDVLAERFEAERPALLRVAYRLLGSRAAAEDAVQEAWFRLARADAAAIDNLPAWLRVTVSRLCLDALRTRTSRREAPEPAGADLPSSGPRPDEVAELADDVGRLLLLVLDALTPAERVALVLHDMFAMPYAEIAPVIGRSEEATKKAVGRARGKVRGRPSRSSADVRQARDVVGRFLAAARAGDVDAILAVLDPDVTRTADPRVLPPGVPTVLRGATQVARGTAALAARSRLAEMALVDGDVGLVVVEDGRLQLAVTFTLEGSRILAYRVLADPDGLDRLVVAPLPGVV